MLTFELRLTLTLCPPVGSSSIVQPSAAQGSHMESASKKTKNKLCVLYEEEGGISWINDGMVVCILRLNEMRRYTHPLLNLCC